MQDCQGMQGDIKRIETWAQIFTEPEKLVETVVANFLANRAAIMSDVSKIEADNSGSPANYK